MEGEVLVSAASSLSDVFAEMESAFEADNPGVDVKLNLGGSSLLAEQVVSGAPVDVFASADSLHMDALAESGLVDGPSRLFAVNSLQLAVPRGNPGGVDALDDVGDPSLFVGLCAVSVPCGRLARQVLDNAGIKASVDSNEPNVRSLLTKIAAAELDAGIVYVTDVLAVGDQVEGIDIADEVNVRADYPIAVITDAPNVESARLFADFVLSDKGQAILADHGFVAP